MSAFELLIVNLNPSQHVLQCSMYATYKILCGVLRCSVDPFSKKDWYDVKAPAMFNIRNLGKTLVTRTQGTSKFFSFQVN